MIVFNDTDQAKLVQSVASSSTFISSVAGHVEEYVLAKFPKSYFKHVYMDTSSTAAQRNQNSLVSDGLNKILYPDITFSPEISIDDPVGIGRIPQISSPNQYLFRSVNSNYPPVTLDPDMKFGIYCTKDYITMNFNVSMRTNSYIQNADIVHYVRSAFQLGMFAYYNARLLSVEIPKTFVSIVSKLKGFDLTTADGRASEEEFLAGSGKRYGSVTLKTIDTTGKYGYFYNEKTDLLITVQDLNAQGTISRASMSEGEYQITMRVQVSAFLPNAFIMSIDDSEFSAVKDDVSLSSALAGTSQETSTGDGIYTMTIASGKLISTEMTYFKTTSGETVIGQNALHELFTLKANQGTTSFPFMAKMKPDFQKAHAYAIAHSMDLSSLVKVTFYTPGSETASFDYTTMTLTVGGVIDADFVVNVYVARATLDAISKAEETDEFFFSDNALATAGVVCTLSDGTTEKQLVRIYSFRNDAEMASQDISKCLRIQTVYGTGYVGLVAETDPNASDYRICVGYDRYGNAIVRALEKA
jgi:hypothetical protein